MVSRILPAFVALALSLFLSSCGGSGDDIPNGEEFRPAIESYLKGQSMDLAIKSFKVVTIAEDGKAHLTLSLTSADAPTVAVKFGFVLAKEGDSWKVESHKQN